MTPPIDQEEEAKDRGFLEEAPAHPRWVGTWRACSSPPAKTSCSAGSSATVCQARSSASCARGFRKASTVAPRTSCRLCDGAVSRPLSFCSTYNTKVQEGRIFSAGLHPKARWGYRGV